MGLVINQGKQDTSQDNKFDIIEEKGVLAQITGIKLSKNQTDSLDFTFKILSGKHKNRIFFDRVNYNPTNQFSWRYRALRKAAGAPYSDSESPNIDIEKLLLNKAVTVDLSKRTGKNKNGDEQDYQNVTYKAPAKPAEEPEEKTKGPLQAVEDDGSDSPFGKAEMIQGSFGDDDSDIPFDDAPSSDQGTDDEDWGGV